MGPTTLRGSRAQLRPGRGALPALPREPGVGRRALARLLRRLRAAAAPADGTGRRRRRAAAPAAPRRAAPPAPRRPAPPRHPRRRRAPTPARRRPVLDGDEPSRSAARRRAPSRTWRRASGCPTATSVRAVPAKLLEVNRQILNNHLARTGAGKVSFTHLIAFAVAARARRLSRRSTRRSPIVDGKPVVVRHQHVNLGLAVDVEAARRHAHAARAERQGRRHARLRRRSGAAYEELIAQGPRRQDLARRLRRHDVHDHQPGHDRHRALGAAADARARGSSSASARSATRPSTRAPTPHTLAQLGVSKVTTLTNTYDHRIITGRRERRVPAADPRPAARRRRLLRRRLRRASRCRTSRRAGTPTAAPSPTRRTQHEKVVQVHSLINMYRVRGHLIANLDPLGRREPAHAPRARHHALRPLDLGPRPRVPDRRPRRRARSPHGACRCATSSASCATPTRAPSASSTCTSRSPTRRSGSRSGSRARRRVVDRRREAPHPRAAQRGRGVRALPAHEVPRPEAVQPRGRRDARPDARRAAAATPPTPGMTDVVLGMAHRGRLNVLANVVGKSYEQIFREFEGELDPRERAGLGRREVPPRRGRQAPVARRRRGRAHAGGEPEPPRGGRPGRRGHGARHRRRRRRRRAGTTVLPVLVHGDAAFAGQGVVAETFNLSEVPGYEVGGTVHVVVNNQLGFTTAPELGRSSVYATDVAKMVQAPIFHVNGDDPEAAVRVIAPRVRVPPGVPARTSSSTSSATGATATTRPTSPRSRSRACTSSSTSTASVRDALHAAARRTAATSASTRTSRRSSRLPGPARRRVRGDARRPASSRRRRPTPALDRPATSSAPATPGRRPRCRRDVLERVVDGAHARGPTASTCTRSSSASCSHGAPMFDARRDRLGARRGARVRLAGARGHAGPARGPGHPARHVQPAPRRARRPRNEREYVPLAHLADDQAPFMLYDTVLSEYAALGFEYGYSVVDPTRSCAGRRSSATSPTARRSSSTSSSSPPRTSGASAAAWRCCSPTASRARGPSTPARASSASSRSAPRTTCASSTRRPRRSTSTCCAARRVAAAARAARLLHAEALPAHAADTLAASTTFTDGAFEFVLDDRADARPRRRCSRVLLCTGKIGHELMDERDERGAPVAVVRVEQLYPWPEHRARSRSSTATPTPREVWWVQEEPANMGAWNFVHSRLHRVLRDRAELSTSPVRRARARRAGAPRSTTPSSERLLAAAFAKL